MNLHWKLRCLFLAFAVSIVAPDVTIAQDPNPAINNPDKLAWELFVELNREVPETGGKVVWETWALARDVFANPNVAPVWPAPNATPRSLQDAEPLLQQLLANKRGIPQDGDLRPLFDPRRPASNETRMNQEAFDFIVQKELYYIEGQEAAFATGAPISFPIPAKEIKARWEPIDPAQAHLYHTAQFVDPTTKETQVWGLKALHITTKDLPNWFWATFEHRDNPAIEDVLPSRDSSGLPASLRATKWENYVLRGTQVDFTDSTGVPTLLGNSIIEGPFVASSSCISCHARSTIGPRIDKSEEANRLPVFERFRPLIRGATGVPDSNLFWDFPNDEPKYQQLDFVWALSRAKFRNPAPAAIGGVMGAEHPVVRATESPLVTSNDQSNQSPGIREALLAVENQSRALASSEGDSSAKSEQWMKNLGTFPGNRKEWEKMLIASNDLSGLVLPGDGADAAAAAVSEDRVGKSLRFNVQVDAHQLSPDEFESLHTMIRESAGDEVAVDPKTQSMTIKRPTYDLLAKLSENDSLNLFEQSALRSNPGTFSPISISPLNLDARVTHLADKASADHDITGKGVTVCVWDEGKVRTTHQEFQLANGTSRVSQSDGASVLSVHSTHVTGTIGAKGEVNQAMGMATDVNILAHDWINDVSEMRNQAAAGAACSNHSYGYSLGWEWSNSGWVWYGSPSQATDYRFGKYHLASRQFDDVAYSHPTMSVFVAAGNDRNNNPPPGVLHSVAQNGQTSTTTRLGDGRYADGYDCMGALAVGKNVITIGAIHDIVGGEATPDRVKVTDFSSWGPTDDGRIKPDVVGNGFQLFSTTITGDDQYHTTSGTSMATPAATGVGAILVECFRKHGIATPRSDQMKSVLIHTAMSPNPGPDYRIGWGSIRADLAADLIAGKGGVLLTSSVQDHDVVWSGKSTGKPIRVTLVWLDPAAEPTTGGANVRTKTLVNDLDLKLIAPDGTTTHYPWSLNPDSPAIAATATSGNHVDNVERVDIASPSNGTWKVEVSWPGNHDSSQPFAWVVSGLTDLTK